ncbi:hypothetical protein HDU86_006011 [Geranomyces michiganensis]|nr:hypothetical protein HDU86_006011 [Geranomyces michiganensis]
MMRGFEATLINGFEPTRQGLEASSSLTMSNDTPSLPPPPQTGFGAPTPTFEQKESALFPPPPQSGFGAPSPIIEGNNTSSLPPPPQSGFGAPTPVSAREESPSLPPQHKSGFGVPSSLPTREQSPSLPPPPMNGFGAPTPPPPARNETPPMPPPPQSGFIAPPQGGFVPRPSLDGGQSKIPPHRGFVPRASFDAAATRYRFDESHHPRHRFHDINAQPELSMRPQSSERVEEPAAVQSPRLKEQSAASPTAAAAVVNNPRAFLGGIYKGLVETLATGSDAVASGIEQAFWKAPALAHHASVAIGANPRGSDETHVSEPKTIPTAQDVSYEQFAGASGEPNGFDSVALDHPTSISADFSEIPLVGGQLASYAPPIDGFDAVPFEDSSFAATHVAPMEASRPDSVLDDLLPATLQAEQELERPPPAKVASTADLGSANAGSPWLESSVYSDGNPLAAGDEGLATAPEPENEWLPAQVAPAVFSARPSSSARASPLTGARDLQAGSPNNGARKEITNEAPFGSYDDATFEVGPDFNPDALPSDLHESRISPTPASEIKPGTPVYSNTGFGAGQPSQHSSIYASSPATESVASAFQATPQYSDRMGNAFAPLQSFDFGPSSSPAPAGEIKPETSVFSGTGVDDVRPFPSGSAQTSVPATEGVNSSFYATSSQYPDPIVNAFAPVETFNFGPSSYGVQDFVITSEDPQGASASEPVAETFDSQSGHGGAAPEQHVDDSSTNAFNIQPSGYGDALWSYEQDAADATGNALGAPYGQEADPVANAFGSQYKVAGIEAENADPVANAFAGLSISGDAHGYQNQQPEWAINPVDPQSKAFAAGTVQASYTQEMDPVATDFDSTLGPQSVANAYGGISTSSQDRPEWAAEPQPSAHAVDTAQGSYGEETDPVANAFGSQLNANGVHAPNADSVADAFHGLTMSGNGFHGQQPEWGPGHAGSQPAYAADTAQVSYPWETHTGPDADSQPSADAGVPAQALYNQQKDPGTNTFDSQTAFDDQPGAYAADAAQDLSGRDVDPVANAFGIAGQGNVDPVANAFGLRAVSGNQSTTLAQSTYGQDADPVASWFGSPQNGHAGQSFYGQGAGTPSQEADPIISAFGLQSSANIGKSPYGEEADAVAKAFASPSSANAMQGLYKQEANAVANADMPQAFYGQEADPVANAFGSPSSANVTQNVHTQEADPNANATGAVANVDVTQSLYGQEANPVTNSFGTPSSEYAAARGYHEKAEPVPDNDEAQHAFYGQEADPVANAFGSSPSAGDNAYDQQADPVANAFGIAAGVNVTQGFYYQEADPVANAFGSRIHSSLASGNDTKGMQPEQQEEPTPSVRAPYDVGELRELMQANDALRSRFAQTLARLPASLRSMAAY